MEPAFDSTIYLKLQALTAVNGPATALDAVSILLKLLRNISENPTQEKFRSIKKSNKAIASKLLNCVGILEILQEIGYTELDNDNLVYSLNEDERLEITLIMTEVVLHEIQDSMKTEEEKERERRTAELKKQSQAKELQRKMLLDKASLDRKETNNRLLPTQDSHASVFGAGNHTQTFKSIGMDLNAQKKG